MKKQWDDFDELFDDKLISQYFAKKRDKVKVEEELNKRFNFGVYKEKKKDVKWEKKFKSRYDVVNGKIVFKRGYVYVDQFDNKGRSDMKELFINRNKMKNVSSINFNSIRKWGIIIIVMFALIRIGSRVFKAFFV